MLRCFLKQFKRKCTPLCSLFEPNIDNSNTLEFLGMFIALTCVFHKGTHKIKRTDVINLHLKERKQRYKIVTSTRFE